MEARMNWLEPVTLEGNLVRLEPLTMDHAAPMFEHFEARAMTFLPRGQDIATLEDFTAYIRSAVENTARIYWAVRILEPSRSSGQIAGFVLYPDAKPKDGWIATGTLLMPAFWGSGANTEAKLLLMTRAFEVLGAVRVQFTVETGNARSMAALEKFAVREAILRKLFAGKDIAIYSVIAEEWLDVKSKLEEKIANGRQV
jgi:N-acetyltransferase